MAGTGAAYQQGLPLPCCINIAVLFGACPNKIGHFWTVFWARSEDAAFSNGQFHRPLAIAEPGKKTMLLVVVCAFGTEARFRAKGPIGRQKKAGTDKDGRKSGPVSDFFALSDFGPLPGTGAGVASF